MRRQSKCLHVVGALVVILHVSRAHAAPLVSPSATPNQEVVCLRDTDGDGAIALNKSSEVTVVSSAEECAYTGGAIAERESREEIADFNKTLDTLPIQSIDDLKLYFSISESEVVSKGESSVRSQTSSLPSRERSAPSSGTESSRSIPPYTTLEINGPINGIRAGGLLPPGTREQIQSRIKPPLKGRRYNNSGRDEEKFNCQEFSEFAENAYRDLTISGVQCSLLCKKEGILSLVSSQWEKVDGFAHMFLDYHEGGAIFFLDPQSAHARHLNQLNLDLNRDGIISPVEEGNFDKLVPFGRFFKKRCVGESKLVCRNHSFEDRQHAYDYWRARGSSVVRPPRLPRVSSSSEAP